MRKFVLNKAEIDSKLVGNEELFDYFVEEIGKLLVVVKEESFSLPSFLNQNPKSRQIVAPQQAAKKPRQ